MIKSGLAAENDWDLTAARRRRSAPAAVYEPTRCSLDTTSTSFRAGQLRLLLHLLDELLALRLGERLTARVLERHAGTGWCRR